MRVFRKYLENRLSNPEFSRYFHKRCAVCPVTIRIVIAVMQSGESMESIADQCGIPAQKIADLKTAEKCCVDSVKKLCDYFRIPQPDHCLQKKDDSRSNEPRKSSCPKLKI